MAGDVEVVYRGNLGQQNHRGETLEMRGARGRRQTGIGERCRKGASLDRLIHRREVWRFKSLLPLGQRGRIQLDVVTVSTRIDEIRARVAVRINPAGRLINTTRTESDLEIGVAIGSDTEHQRAHQRRPRSGENHHEGQRNDVHQVSVSIQVPVSFSTTAMPQSCGTTKVTPRGTHGQYESGSPDSSLHVVCDGFVVPPWFLVPFVFQTRRCGCASRDTKSWIGPASPTHDTRLTCPETTEGDTKRAGGRC